MGGVMDYRRFRQRNGLAARPATPAQPYDFPINEAWAGSFYSLNGDLNRMEADYLGESGHDQADLLIDELSAATGVDPETARVVLRHVFRGGMASTSDPPSRAV